MDDLAEKTAIKRVTKRTVAKDLTYRKILESARQAFISNSYESVTIRSLAEQVERSTGSFYANFASKEEAFEAIVAQDYAGYEENISCFLHGEPELHDSQIMRCIVGTLSLDYQTGRLAILRTEAALSWAQSPAPGSLENRRMFLFDLFQRYSKHTTATRLYFSYAWAMHLENCRRDLGPNMLKENMATIKLALEGKLGGE